MRQEPAEEPCPPARPVGQDARDQASVVVVERRPRHPAEEGKGVNVAIHPGLGGGCRIGTDVAGVAVRQVEREEVGCPLDPADHHRRFAEISLGMARLVMQRDKHLPPAALLLAHVILDDGVAASEPVLVPQPIKNPLGRVTLLAVLANIVAQPLVDDLGEPVQLRPLDRHRPPIPRRYRKAQHLLHALARNPKMTCRLARTHPVPKGETNLQIQFHGENPPALPAARKGKSGRVLLRPQRDYPAATVADFSTAVLTLPAPVGAMAFQNKAAVYAILFRAAAETLRVITADPRHLGAEIGGVAVLHSWDQAMQHHPHVHCIVPGGGLSPYRTRWIAMPPGSSCRSRCSGGGAAALPRTSRRRRRRGGLRFFGDLTPLAGPRAFAAHCAALRRSTGWSTQAALRRPRAGAGLSRPLHPSRRHRQQPPRRPKRQIPK